MKYDDFVNLDLSQSKVNNRDPWNFAIKNPSLKVGYFIEIGETFSTYCFDGPKQQKGNDLSFYSTWDI